jgi:hypothetical protein
MKHPMAQFLGFYYGYPALISNACLSHYSSFHVMSRIAALLLEDPHHR